MAGSSAPESPASCTRTTSRSDFLRNRPRMMSLLKFSSAASASIPSTPPILATGHQPRADPRRLKTGLILAPDLFGLLPAAGQVRLHLGGVLKVKSNDRVNVRQIEG